MVLFDVSKYEIPDPQNVDIEKTKYNVGVFMSTYLASRCRVGQPREPNVTASFSLIPPSTVDSGPEAEQLLFEKEEAKAEYDYLHDLFKKGYSTIQHPFKPDTSERRKKIFYDRYISGLSVYVTAQRNMISEDTVSQEATKSIIQFASALGAFDFSLKNRLFIGCLYCKYADIMLIIRCIMIVSKDKKKVAITQIS